MNKIVKIGLVIFVSSILAWAFYTSNSKSTLPQALHSQVAATINHAEGIPGLKSEEFALLKPGIAEAWNLLVQEGVLEKSGPDKEVRPYFVALQGVVEHVLASALSHQIHNLQGIILTPLPATPLCTQGEISKELVDPSIEMDPQRLFTVKVRTTIVRDYLAKGGKLFVAYPKEGFQKRTAEQQAVYTQELLKHPNYLVDMPLNCAEVSQPLIGALYQFQDDQGETFVFAIKMTQAKDPQEKGNFGLWFGPLKHRAIQKRVQSITAFLEQNGFTIK